MRGLGRLPGVYGLVRKADGERVTRTNGVKTESATDSRFWTALVAGTKRLEDVAREAVEMRWCG